MIKRTKSAICSPGARRSVVGQFAFAMRLAATLLNMHLLRSAWTAPQQARRLRYQKANPPVGTSGITFTMGPDTRAVAWWWKT